jgi:hypothetical protein
MSSIVNFSCRHRFIIGVLLVFFLLRTVMVLFGLWSPYEVMALQEGLLSGNLAYDLHNGTWRGLDHYLFHTSGHLGNEIIIGFLAYPLFYLFGSSLFVLHLIPTIWAMCLVILVYVFARTEISERAARIAVVLLVCAPFALQAWSIVPHCIHLESALFSIGAFFLFVRMQRSETRRSRLLLSACLGFVCGFGIFHSETMLLSCGIVAVFWIIRKPKFIKTPEFWVCVLCFFVGFAPYFYIGVEYISVFIHSFFNYRYAWNHAQTREQFSLLSTFGVMAIWFWPIGLMFLYQIPDLVITSFSILCGFCAFLICIKRFFSSYVVLMLCFYCGGFALVLLKSRVSMDYYAYPPFAHWMLVWGICIDFLLVRFKPGAGKLKVVYVVIGLLCLSSVIHIFSFAKFSNIKEQFSQRFISRGYCFYWPQSYAAYPGYKTKMGKQIEWEATTKEINDIHSHNEPRIDGQWKTFFLSMALDVSTKLESEKDYARYGMDVSFLGFHKLAQDIADNVAENFKDRAYASMAVFYANDFLWDNITPMLEEGTIEAYIPESYRHWFYEELGRKIKEQGDELSHFNDFINKLPTLSEDAREWMHNGFFEAEFYAEVPQRKS